MRYALFMKNALRLLLGNGFAALAAFLSTILTARGLGAEIYGVMVFITAFAGLVGQLLTFNAWQALITFGSRALQDNNESAFVALVKKAFGLDMVSGFLGCATGMILSGHVVEYLSWEPSIVWYLRLYCLSILCRFDGAAAGILRLLGRFNALAGFSVFSASVRLAGVATAFVAGGDMQDYLLAYLAAVFVGQLYLLAAVARALGRQRLMRCLKSSAGHFPEFKGFYAYVWTTNLHSSVKIVTRELDQIIAAAVLPPAAIGMLKIAREFARILHMLADPLYHSLFPELSSLWATGNRCEFLELMKKTAKTAAVCGIVGIALFLMSGRLIIVSAFGESFAGAFYAAVVFMLASLTALVSLPLQPAMLAAGRPEASFYINLAATIAYLLLLVPLMKLWSINGAAVAYVVYYIIWAVLMQNKLRQTLKEHA